MLHSNPDRVTLIEIEIAEALAKSIDDISGKFRFGGGDVHLDLARTARAWDRGRHGVIREHELERGFGG